MIVNKNVLDMCIGVDANFITNLDNPFVDLLNDKYYARKLLKNKIPMLDYSWYSDGNQIKSILENNQNAGIVIQKNSGAGGDGTFLINEELLKNGFKYDENTLYCVSNYIPNIPLNITLIIGKNETVYLPLSVQLIKLIDNKFKYVGGDFSYTITLNDSVKNQVLAYSKIIADELKMHNYLGIVGIDYILLDDNQIYFMEINPRFQSSSFLLSRELEKVNNTNIAKLHFEALNNNTLDDVTLTSIDKSFINCCESNNYDLIKSENEIVFNGYYKENETSIYRRVFNRSILDEDIFEKIKRR